MATSLDTSHNDVRECAGSDLSAVADPLVLSQSSNTKLVVRLTNVSVAACSMPAAAPVVSVIGDDGVVVTFETTGKGTYFGDPAPLPGPLPPGAAAVVWISGGVPSLCATVPTVSTWPSWRLGLPDGTTVTFTTSFDTTCGVLGVSTFGDASFDPAGPTITWDRYRPDAPVLRGLALNALERLVPARSPQGVATVRRVDVDHGDAAPVADLEYTQLFAGPGAVVQITTTASPAQSAAKATEQVGRWSVAAEQTAGTPLVSVTLSDTIEAGTIRVLASGLTVDAVRRIALGLRPRSNGPGWDVDGSASHLIAEGWPVPRALRGLVWYGSDQPAQAELYLGEAQLLEPIWLAAGLGTPVTIDIRGHATLIVGDLSLRIAVWQEASGVVGRLAARGLEHDNLVDVIASMATATADQWNAIPTYTFTSDGCGEGLLC